MGENGYIILVWDGYGSGLVRINPRLHSEGTDLHGNPCNWWTCKRDMLPGDIRHLISKHNLRQYKHFEFFWDERSG